MSFHTRLTYIHSESPVLFIPIQRLPSVYIWCVFGTTADFCQWIFSVYKKCTHLASLHVGHGSWTVENSSFFHLSVMDFHSMFSHATHVLTCCTCGNECTVSVDSGQVNPSLWRV